jgi:urease accessory protein UreF
MNTAQAQLKAMDGFHRDLSALCCRLGNDASLTGLPGSIRLEQVTDSDSFLVFIRQYKEHILEPIELPAIASAMTLCSQNALRELLDLDAGLGKEPFMKVFAESSRTLGRNQLRKLRGLHDVRMLSRYRNAVLDGKAYGWHLLVYGMVLHMFSIPLRQGLAKYQTQVLLGFGQAACQSLSWSEKEWMKVRHQLESFSAPSLEGILAEKGSGTPLLSIV